ncbi:MAG: hypothetical protein ACTSYI_04090, partial [Promethearchaeota archaeon]
ILQTAKFLKSRFEQGAVDPNFYIRRMRYFYQQILEMQEELLRNQTSLLEIIEGFNLEGNLKTIIATISSTMDYQFNQLAQQWSLDPFQLAAGSTQVTSDFITLLDYLHIAEDFDPEFITELLENLLASLDNIHTFSPFAEHIRQLQTQLPQYFQDCSVNQKTSIDQIRKAYSQVEEIIYATFQNFKEYLHLAS